LVALGQQVVKDFSFGLLHDLGVQPGLNQILKVLVKDPSRLVGTRGQRPATLEQLVV
jgi:hypothetical protein